MKRALVGILVVIGLLSVVAQAQETERLFKAAMNAELVDGDLKAAIEQYKKVAETPDRALAAKALVRMAECYQKLGNSEGQKVYERILRDFQDQPESVAIARAHLGGTSARPAEGVTLHAIPNSNVLAGAVSPDGRYFVFASWDDGHLYVRDLRTGADRDLTQRDDFNIGISAISPDAALVAYQSYAGGCDGKRGGLPALCLVSLAGKGVPASRAILESDEILEIAPMAWSPDGRSIAVSLRRRDRTAQIGLVTLADGLLHGVQTVDWRGPTRIFFSPSGQDLVFDLAVSDDSDNRDIKMLALDGTQGVEGVTIVEDPSRDFVMGWAPDGSQLLFASDRGGSLGLWAQPFVGRRPQGLPRLLRGGLAGAWSLGVTKDGAMYFGASKNDRDIFVSTIDLAAGKQIGQPMRPIRRFAGTNLMPEWSKDGKHLAYVSQRGLEPFNAGRMIGIRDMTTGDERELHPKLLYFGNISWSPDGSTLLTSGTDIKGRTGIFTVDARTAAVSLVAEGVQGSDPHWSPDGKRVYYRNAATLQQGRNFNIVERDLASGSERTVATGDFQVFSISPDGSSLVAPVLPSSGGLGSRVVQIVIATGEMRDVLNVAPAAEIPPFIAPQWTPDGKGVLVRKRSPNELWLVPTTGAPPRKLDADVRNWSFGAVGKFSLHPDGQRIAFLSGSLSGEVMVLENFLQTIK